MKKPTALKLAAAAVPILVLGLGGITVGTMAADQERKSNDRNGFEERAADERTEAPPIERMPTQGVHASDLIEQMIHNRKTDDEIGQINDLVIDQDGRIVAVVISTGTGLLGIGGKEVAIAWDRIERASEDEEIKLYVDMNEDTLQEEPGYERD